MKETATKVEEQLDAVLVLHWKKYRQEADSSSRTWLIHHYLPLARMLAAYLYRLRGDNSVLFDDFIQYARIGLIEAIDRFDPGRGIPFRRYAVRRVRGSILNGLGKESEQAAQWKRRRREVHSERLQSLTQQSESRSENTLDIWFNRVVVLALGVLLEQDDHPSDDSTGANPYAKAELQCIRRTLMKSVEQLPDREAEIVKLHYFEQLEFQLIADMLEITKGRVSQLHARAMDRLRMLLKDRALLDTTY